MEIQNGVAVGMAYHLTDLEGNTLDKAETAQPFWYLHGSQNIIAGLESELAGLKAGETKKVVVQPEQGYGAINDQLMIDVERSQLGEVEGLEVGMRFVAESPDGQEQVFNVIGMEGDVVKLDGNHSLAGIVLTFDVEILEIRAATDEEKEHGHIHGPGGHEH
jgi:FKBP-type peptidyl-prolyl cis-trans isomerase SlyD